MHIEVVNIVKLKWIIIGFDNYAFGENKKLYNIKRGKEVTQKVNGGSVGWWLGRKFFTQKRIEPLLRIPNNYYVPF